MAKGKGLILAGVACLVGYALLKAKTVAPAAVYQSGPVILKVTKVQDYGFSYEIWIGGKMIFTDTIYAGDDSYDVQSTIDPAYTVSMLIGNDQPTIDVYDQAGNQVNAHTFNLYWNGTLISSTGITVV